MLQNSGHGSHLGQVGLPYDQSLGFPRRQRLRDVTVRFDEPIGDRQAAQDAIKVTTEPAVEGAFYWLNNAEVRWRPAEYWPAGTTVNVEVDIYGKDLGNGYYGQENNATNFTIGDRVVAIADDATKTMTTVV